MTRGGKRQGSGRKRGSKTIRSQKVAEKALKSGKATPLDVILKAMYHHYDKKEWAAAATFAVQAAPYMHPKLQAIQHTGAGGGPIQTEDVSARDILADRIARLATRK